jgi:uncharacterized membrane protein
MIPYALAAVLFAGYTALSVSRHEHLRTTGFDLGIFEQAVRAYAELRAPVSELKGPGYNLLGDHFHPILAVLAPVYRLFPGPVTLLVAQAALLACSAIPVTRLAMRHAGPVAGGCLGVAYGLSFGLQNAVGFDFHEVAFAVPLLAFSLERLALREWTAAAAWALPLVLVKEDLSLTVAAIGVYIAVGGRRRLGAALATFGVVAFALVVFVVIPTVNPAGHNPYLGQVGGWENPLVRFFAPGVKGATVAALLVPTAFVALRSPLLLIAVPTIAWRFWAANPAYWGTGGHYNAVLMPVVFVACADALHRIGRAWLPAVVAAFSLAVTAHQAPHLPLWDLTSPAAWSADHRTAAARQLIREIPDGAVVAAANHLVPQLTNRTTVYLFPEDLRHGVRPQWIVVLDPPDPWPDPDLVRARQADMLARGYDLVGKWDGVLLYRARPG